MSLQSIPEETLVLHSSDYAEIDFTFKGRHGTWGKALCGTWCPEESHDPMIHMMVRDTAVTVEKADVHALSDL